MTTKEMQIQSRQICTKKHPVLFTADRQLSHHAQFSDGLSMCLLHRTYAGSRWCHRKMQPGVWRRTAPRVSGADVDRDCACAGKQHRSHDTDRNESLLSVHRRQFLQFQNQTKDHCRFQSPKTCTNNAHAHALSNLICCAVNFTQAQRRQKVCHDNCHHQHCKCSIKSHTVKNNLWNMLLLVTVMGWQIELFFLSLLKIALMLCTKVFKLMLLIRLSDWYNVSFRFWNYA